MNKRGISILIGVVLLILITVSAVGIVWQVVIPLAKQSTEVTEKCQATSLEINKKSFYNASSGQASILVSRGVPIMGTETEVVLTAIQIKITSDTGDSKTVTINETEAALPKVNEDKLYNINLSDLTGSSFKVEVAPVIEVNKKKRLCQMTRKHSLQYTGTPQNCSDSDGDGYAIEGGGCGPIDCNDTNLSINPGANETCGNGIDEDCDGVDLPCASLNCSDYWGFDCGVGPPESGDNTFDDCGNGKGFDESVEEIYLNRATIGYGEALNVTCEFDPYTSSDDTYISYYNGSAWFVLYSHTDWGSASITNESVVFIPNSTEGQHWVRCSITYYVDEGTNECMNPSTDTYYDNDDLSFNVMA